MLHEPFGGGLTSQEPVCLRRPCDVGDPNAIPARMHLGPPNLLCKHLKPVQISETSDSSDSMMLSQACQRNRRSYQAPG